MQNYTPTILPIFILTRIINYFLLIISWNVNDV